MPATSSHTFQLPAVRRTRSELAGEADRAHRVLQLKCSFADPMLLHVVELTQADGPFVGRLHAHAAISADSDMGAFDGSATASANRAGVTPDPGPVASTRPTRTFANRLGSQVWEDRFMHAQPPQAAP